MEFHKPGEKWYCEGWVDFGHHFGLGITFYHEGGTWSLDVTIPFVNFYVTFFRPASWWR